MEKRNKTALILMSLLIFVNALVLVNKYVFGPDEYLGKISYHEFLFSEISNFPKNGFRRVSIILNLSEKNFFYKEQTLLDKNLSKPLRINLLQKSLDPGLEEYFSNRIDQLEKSNYSVGPLLALKSLRYNQENIESSHREYSWTPNNITCSIFDNCVEDKFYWSFNLSGNHSFSDCFYLSLNKNLTGTIEITFPKEFYVYYPPPGGKSEGDAYRNTITINFESIPNWQEFKFCWQSS